MCRSLDQGGRRCPYCASFTASASANGNRRAARAARRAVVDHLARLGLTETAAAVLAAPPSVLAGFLAAAGLQEEALTGIRLPSTHSSRPPADDLLARLEAERQAHLTPPVVMTVQQLAVVDAADAVAAAKAALAAAGPKDPQVDQLHRTLQEARQDLAAARFELTVSELQRASSKDARYAALSETQAAEICAALSRRHIQEVAAAFSAINITEVTDAASRDKSIYQAAKIRVDTGVEGGIEEVEARVLDGGTAIYRRGYGDFQVLQQKFPSGPFMPVAAASSKDAALAKAHRIPLVTVQPLPADADPLTVQAHALAAGAVTDLAGKAAEGAITGVSAQQKSLDGQLAAAAGTLADRVGAESFRAAVFEATRRHQRRVLEKAAEAAGKQARAQVLAQGGTAAEAAAADRAARRKAMGTPTRGGGVIPHFDHKIPPQGLGQAKYAAAYRSGVRLFGGETAQDYTVVAARGGDLAQWGFKFSGSQVQTSNISQLTAGAAGFIASLASHERSAITTYTGGSYRQINAAITGRDPQPASHIATVVTNLEAAFDKHVKANTSTAVMTVMRGTGVPSAWPGSRTEYLAQAFVPGAKVQVGKVTSFTTKASTAQGFTQANPYLMVVRTRDGLPVKSISSFASEDEVVLPPGSNLRCIKVDHTGPIPTVFLVAEDLVAEAETPTTH